MHSFPVLPSDRCVHEWVCRRCGFDANLAFGAFGLALLSDTSQNRNGRIVNRPMLRRPCVGHIAIDVRVRGDAGSSVFLAKHQRRFRHDLGNWGIAITEMDRGPGSQDVESRLGHLVRKTEAIGRIEAGVREHAADGLIHTLIGCIAAWVEPQGRCKIRAVLTRIRDKAAAFDLVRRLLALGEIDWHADRPLENPAALDAMLAVS